MHEKKFKELLKEMNKYRKDTSIPRIQEWELISICNEIALVIAQMRKDEVRYEMTDRELEDVQWVYAYLRTRTNYKG